MEWGSGSAWGGEQTKEAADRLARASCWSSCTRTLSSATWAVSWSTSLEVAVNWVECWPRRMPCCVTAVLNVSAPAESISGLTVLSGKNTDSIAGSTQIFIKVSEHKTRPVKRAGSHNSRQRIETGRGNQSNQASSHSTRQRV